MQRRSFLSRAAAVLLLAAIAFNAAQAQALTPNHAELEKAALDAGPAGMFALGRSYQLGAGVPINYAQAVVWLQKAVDAGHAQAMTVLGVMYHKAAGVPHDEARSQALIARAFALGDPHALALQLIMSGDLAVQAGNSFAAIKVANAHIALNAARGTRSNTVPLQWLRKAETMGNPHAVQQIRNLSTQ